MKTAKAFSHGKVILSGEYSALYGYSALVGGIDFGVEVELREKNNGEIVEYDEYINHIINFFAKNFGQTICDFSLKINSNLPQKSGLGSSSAVASALIMALAQWFNFNLSKQKLFEIVWQCENWQHGKSSGVDAAGVVFGGLVIFKKNSEISTIETFKTNCLKDKKFLLIDSGQAEESTKEMVQLINAKLPAKNVMTIISKIGELTNDFIVQLRQGIFDPQILRKKNALLIELGVVGKIAQNIIQNIEQTGGFAKITGAGGIRSGSGFILAYHSDLNILKNFVKHNNYESFEICFS